MEKVELKRDGRSYEMVKNQLSTSNIAMVFGLDPKTIWLKDRLTGRCYFPDDDIFKEEEFEDHTYTLIVEGAPPSSDRVPLSFSVGASPSDQAGPSTPSVKSSGQLNKMYNSCTTKIVKAEKKHSATGKIEFHQYEATYIDLKPSTANINYVQSCVQKMWGLEYTVVSNDGLQICDSSATRGIKFWRVGSRKLFAIEASHPSGKKRQRHSSEEVDGGSVSDKLDAIDFKLTKILEVTPHMPLPLGLSTLLFDSFRCQICKSSPITPPAIFARCCQKILGCRECVDEWYKGDNALLKTCPLCRNDRGVTDTSKILGIDELLVKLNDILNVPQPPRDLPSIDID